MTTSFGALCDDFYVNHAVALHMELPDDRETLLHLFDRIRAAQPSMSRFHRYSDELSLESPRRDSEYRWLSLRARMISSGMVNPQTLEQAYELHKLVLRLSPHLLSLSPLDIESQELLFGFDLDAEANQNQIVHDALMADSPLSNLLDGEHVKPLDVQPLLGISLNEKCDLQAFFEVRTTTSNSQIRRDSYRTEPLSVLLTLRKMGPTSKVDDLLTNFEVMREHAERLAAEKVIPHLLNPISEALAGRT